MKKKDCKLSVIKVKFIGHINRLCVKCIIIYLGFHAESIINDYLITENDIDLIEDH